MNEIITIFEQVGAIVEGGHFVYTSGKHGSVYIRKDRIYPHPALTSRVCELVAERVNDLPIEVVVGPSMGGIILSQWTAFHLGKKRGSEVLGVFTEKNTADHKVFDKGQVFKRGYDSLVKGKKVLVVEDLTNTGASVKKVVDQVKKAGGEVVMVVVLVNRNPNRVHTSFMEAPFLSLATYEAEAFEPEDCVLCKRAVPINTEVGHGKEYLEMHAKK